MKRPFLPLHVLTDTVIQDRYSHFEIAQRSWEAGAQVVQYRHKAFDPSRDLTELREMARLAESLGKVLVVNDRPDLALQVGAQGVHLGKDDGSPWQARELLGPGAVIGATVHDLDELEALRGAPIDYIGVGPVFGTRSKSTGLPDLGLQRLESICRASPFPVIGIGSIHPDNALQVLQAGARGVAVLSAVCQSTNPEAVVTSLLEQLG